MTDEMLPTEADAIAFSTAELLPLVENLEGPVDTFTLEKAIKQDALAHAVATGELVGDFAACPPFDNLDQKKLRQEAKRGAEILRILQERDGQPLTTEDVLVGRVAEFRVQQAVVVEASKRSAIAHAAGDTKTADFCDELLRGGLDYLYNAPTPELAGATAHAFRPSLDVVLESTDALVQQTAQAFVERYPFMLEASGELPRLSPEIHDAILKHLQETFGQAFSKLREEFGEISNDKIVAVTKRLLEKVGLAHIDEQGVRTGWDAKSVDDRAGFLADSRDEVVKCGTRSSEITWEGYEKLAVHEVGDHAWRTRNSRKLGSALLEQDLPGAVDFEESLGMLFEEVWSGETEGIGRGDYRYLIASYATGALDGVGHDKNETYQFITGLKLMHLMATRVRQAKPVDLDALVTSARRLMFEHTYRGFRGMPEGVVMIKDTGYEASKVNIINYANSHRDDPEAVVSQLLIAKINTLDPEQLAFAEAEKAKAA